MNADIGILTNLLNAFVGVFSAGSGNLLPAASRLFFLIAGIELTLAGIWWALKGENILVGLLQKMLLIGMFAFFVLNWGSFLTVVLNGFVWTGFVAGGQAPAAGIALMKNPSAIISQAMIVTQPIATQIGSLSWYAIGSLFMYGWAYIFTILAFFILAIQVFVTYLEFHLVAALSLILVPFGVFRHTAFVAERALGAVVSFGVKLMVLSFIVAATNPVLNAIVVPANPTITQAYSVLLAALALAFLAWQAPAIAAGMISGGPSLTAGSAAGFAGAAALGAFGAAAVTSAAARTVASAGVGATRAAAGAFGTARTAGAIGAAAASVTSTTATGRAAGALAGMGRAAAGGLAQMATRPIAAAAGSLREAYQRGQVRAFTYTGGKAPASITTPAIRGVASPATGGTAPLRPQSALQAVHLAKSAIPPEGHAGAGLHAPIKPE
jgi:type IV secretion system protein TrbL